MTQVTISRVTEPRKAQIKAHTAGHRAFAVHLPLVQGRNATPARDGYVVTHLRSGLVVSYKSFKRVATARQVARCLQQIVDRCGDFGRFGDASDAHSHPAYRALEHLLELITSHGWNEDLSSEHAAVLVDAAVFRAREPR